MLSPHPGWLALIAGLGLSLLGIGAIRTAEAGNNTSYASAQTVWLCIALVAMLICLVPHPRQISLAAFPGAIVTLFLLIFVIMPFVPASIVSPRNGARSWINLGFMSFQPSELAKIVFVIAVARYLRFRENYRTIWGLLVPFVIMFVPMALILKEPDLGTALLFPPALFVMLVVAGAKLRHLGTLVALTLLAIALNVAAIYYLPESMQLLKPHQRARITSVISRAQGETRYDKSIGYQQRKGIVLIGAGGATGFGQERSATIVRFNRLPEAHNDMIFAVVVNRWGLTGALTMLGLYLLLVLSFILVAMRSKDPFTRLAVIGFAGLIFSQAMINIGMNIGLLPITGITLPFVSYGGSSLATTFAIIGLVFNFAAQPQAIVTRPSFEFDHADVIYQ